MTVRNDKDLSRSNIREYLFSMGFFAALTFLLAIMTFHPSDPSPFTTSSRTSEIQNLFGPTGATLADWSVQLFGFGAPTFALLALVEIVIAYKGLTTKTTWKLRALGIPQLVLCYLGLLAAITPYWSFHDVRFASGGYVGSGMNAFFTTLFGKTGAIAALFFAVLASLPLCIGVKPVSLVVKLLNLTPFLRAQKIAQDLEEKSHDDFATPSIKTSAKNRENETPAQERDFVVAPHKIPERPTAPVKIAANRAAEAANTEAQVAPTSNQGYLVEDHDFQSLLAHFKDAPAPNKSSAEEENQRLKSEARILEEKLATFSVLGTVVHSQPGPVVNVHEFEPAPGIKVSKVLGLQDDLALGLKARSVLMAPQSGKSTIGIEIPAATREMVSLKELLASSGFRSNRSTLPMALGKMVDGSPLVVDLAAMPHLLVAGSTGSGKSVGINVMLISLMMRHTPQQVKLILVDPKMLELSVYDDIGHLLMPVVTDPQKAAGALRWAIDEMERRYRLMKKLQVRNVHSFNQVVESGEIPKELQEEGLDFKRLPYIVVVIDELCDLMMTAPKDVEDCVQRLAQKARAAGIHLILATQRPSVDVLTGVIKANLPCRLSFQVASRHDSRTIIESIGAEKLLGKGDMLFLPPGANRLIRSHCAFASDSEIAAVTNHLRQLFPKNYDTSIMQQVDRASEDVTLASASGQSNDALDIDGNSMDENSLYDRAIELAVDAGTVSTSSIQRHFRIGYNRAARIMDRMIKEGVVSNTEVAGKPRQVVAQRLPAP